MSAWKPPQGIEPPAFAPLPGRKSLKLPPKIKNKSPLIGKAVLELDRFARDVGSGLWVYRDGCYRPHGDRAVLRRLRELTLEGDAEIFSRHRAKEVAAWIEADAPTLWEQPPLDVVNVRNGLLEIASGELRPHSPDHLSPVQIPIVYDSAACCPAWDQFVDDVFPEDSLALAWEMLGWLMVPDVTRKKAVLLLGDGDNGKSIWIEVGTAFLGGAENVSNSTLHELEANRFHAAKLVGKLANCCADLPSAHLAGTSTFLRLVGGDMLPAERKFGQPFDFRPFARLLFSANLPPRSKDSTEAFFKRWLVVPFTAVFGAGGHPARDRAEIVSELLTVRELSGALNRAVAGLQALRARGGFEVSASMTEAAAEFRKTTDPLVIWLDRELVRGPGLWVRKDALSDAYRRECEKAGRNILSDKAFGTELRKHIPGLQDKQKTVGAKRKWAWLGIGLRSASDYDAETVGHER